MRRRILHIADLHLGDSHAYLGAKAGARRVEADGLFRRIAAWALTPDSGIAGLLIAGDLFDRHDPEEALVASVLEDLARLSAAGIRLLTVPGNHDEYSYPGCVYRRHGDRWPGTLVTRPSVGRVDTWEIEGFRIEIHAMAFVAGRSRGPFEATADPPEGAGHSAPGSALRRLLVLHGSLDAPWSDRSIPLRSAPLGSLGFDYVALGHIHRPLRRKLGSGWVCYPGRIEGGGFDDPGGAGLVVFDPAKPEPEVVPFPSRPVAVEEWNLSALPGEDALEERLLRLADPERIQRLRLTGVAGFPLDAGRLAARWADRFHHLEIEAAAASLPSDLEEIARERTVRGQFVRIALRAAEGSEPLAGEALRCGLAAFSAARKEQG